MNKKQQTTLKKIEWLINTFGEHMHSPLDSGGDGEGEYFQLEDLPIALQEALENKVEYALLKKEGSENEVIGWGRQKDDVLDGEDMECFSSDVFKPYDMCELQAQIDWVKEHFDYYAEEDELTQKKEYETILQQLLELQKKQPTRGFFTWDAEDVEQVCHVETQGWEHGGTSIWIDAIIRLFNKDLLERYKATLDAKNNLEKNEVEYVEEAWNRLNQPFKHK